MIIDQLRPKMDLVRLSQRQVIYHVDDFISHLYFVERGLISLIKIMQDGRTIEIGLIGIEGMLCPSAVLGLNTALFDTIVQIPGSALRLQRSLFLKHATKNEMAHELIQHYMAFAIREFAQTAACNRLHPMEQRCCRWLLIAHDSARADTFPLTHEFLAMMLGVQRAGVSITASMLQRAGLIRYTRGSVTIVNRAELEKAACECYGSRAQLLNPDPQGIRRISVD
jgi:CRP-like cAMP-binding protein